MNDNNITRFEVRNFKKFDHLVVEDIGQVNLITGDNNVGKTTLLEALLFSENESKWIKYLHQTLDNRNLIFHLEDVRSISPQFPADNYLQFIFGDLKNPLLNDIQFQSGKNLKLTLECKDIQELSEKESELSKNYYNINVADWLVFHKKGVVQGVQWVYFDDTLSNNSNWMPIVSGFRSLSNDIDGIISDLYPSEKKFIINAMKTWVPGISDYDFANDGTLKQVAATINHETLKYKLEMDTNVLGGDVWQ